uniref:Acyl carrier protein n=1 Tax=Roseihalotalea indica TaxID=2867963 RepID=A0AA49JGR6_9BACT|nr:acyl carrier protein [Tunicatimonas sp. TK19036]
MNNLTQVISEVLNEPVSNLRLETKLKDIGSWDSLNHMVLITQLEEEFNIEFSGDEIAEMESIEDIANIFESKGVNFDV